MTKTPSTELALSSENTVSTVLAGRIGMKEDMLIDTVRAQCFRPKQGETVTEFQVAAFISIAVEMKVNPLLPGMLYAYPIAGGGIVPIMGPDGVFKKLSEHPDIASWEVEVFPADPSLPPTHATAKIYRKGVERPIIYTAALNEWKIGSNPNWSSRPRHMLQLRALKHAARQVIHGIPLDEDDRHIMIEQEKLVSPGAPGQEPDQREQRADPTELRKGRAKGTKAEAPKGEVIELTHQGEAPASTPPAATPPAAPPVDPTAETGTLVPLEDKKKYVLMGAKVVSSEYMDFPKDGKARHGAKGFLSSPGYSGPFIHIAGGREVATADGVKHQVVEAWSPGTVVTVEMRGAFSPSKKKVLCMVDKVAVEQGEEEGAP